MCVCVVTHANTYMILCSSCLLFAGRIPRGQVVDTLVKYVFDKTMVILFINLFPLLTRTHARTHTHNMISHVITSAQWIYLLLYCLWRTFRFRTIGINLRLLIRTYIFDLSRISIRCVYYYFVSSITDFLILCIYVQMCTF